MRAPDAAEESLSLAAEDRIDAVCGRFEAAWKNGERPHLEDFLGDTAGLERESLLRELLRVELHYRTRAGEATTIEEYRGRFPLASSWIDSLLRADATKDWAPPERHAGSDGEGALPRLDGHEVLGELRRGGEGVVYRANDLALARPVAVKMLAGPATPREREHFRRGAEAQAKLDHPNIVPIYAVGVSEGRPFFSMKLLQGSLAEHLARNGPLPPDEAARLAAQVARAVHHAHQRFILHRDLKPANILLSGPSPPAPGGTGLRAVPPSASPLAPSGHTHSPPPRSEEGAGGRSEGPLVPHVADFGLARRLDADASLRSIGAIRGTPAYMAPEQARGETELTTAVDVHGLGAVLYEMLTGQPPFKGASLYETLEQVTSKEPMPIRQLQPDVPPALERICLKCLKKNAADRYPSAEAVADRLERYLRGELSEVVEPSAFRGQLWQAVVRLHRAVGSSQSGPASVASWSAFWWTVLNVAALHVGIFLLAWTGQPVVCAWLLHGTFSTVSLIVLWYCFHLRYDSLSVMERQNLAIHFGSVFVFLAMFAATTPSSPLVPARELLPRYYPALSVVSGCYIYVFGVTSRGSYYVLGLAHLPLAFVLRLVPDWSPLIFTAFVATHLVWIALDWRQPAPRRPRGDKAPSSR